MGAFGGDSSGEPSYTLLYTPLFGDRKRVASVLTRSVLRARVTEYLRDRREGRLTDLAVYDRHNTDVTVDFFG